MFGKRSILQLEEILSKMDHVISAQSRKCEDLLEIDKYLQKETDISEGTRKSENSAKLGLKDRLRNIEVPICHMYEESARAFLVGTFLTGSPIFQSVASRDHEDVASMLTSLTARDQSRLGWVGELTRCMQDVLSYNKCAAEINWAAIRAVTATTKIEGGQQHRTGAVMPTIYEGNLITRLDPYNLILDPDVEPGKVHVDGTFAGYIESLNYIRLKLRYHQWDDKFTIKQNIGKIFQGKHGSSYGNSTTYYYAPLIRKDVRTTSGADTNWAHLFGNNTTHNMDGATGKYEVVTLYKRIIPREYDLTVPNGGMPQTFKLIWVNGLLAYAEPLVVGHEYLPIAVGQLYPGSGEVKSYVEYLTDMQDLATGIMIGTVDSMRRAVGDRAIYDSNRIRKADIENPDPTGKIAVINNTYGANLDSAYKHIPYQDTITAQFQTNLSTVMGLAQESTGLNKAAQGSFIRGNKTAFEFDTIMSNSQSRLQLGAINLENSFFAPIKEMLKLNYLIYATAEEIENHITGTTIQIDPVMLRKFAPEFRMADGIMPSTKLAGTEVLMQAIQAMSMDPMLSLEYDIGGIVVSTLRQQGFNDLEKYKRTPEQMQQVMQMQMMQAQLQSGAPAGAQPTQTGEGEE